MTDGEVQVCCKWESKSLCGVYEDHFNISTEITLGKACEMKESIIFTDPDEGGTPCLSGNHIGGAPRE